MMIALIERWARAWWLTSVIPVLWEAEVSRSFEARILKPAWLRWWNPVSTKNIKISQIWWCMPVISAIREAEAGESLELRRQSLQWAEIAPLHSSLSDREQDSISTTTKHTEKRWIYMERSNLSKYNRHCGALHYLFFAQVISVLLWQAVPCILLASYLNEKVCTIVFLLQGFRLRHKYSTPTHRCSLEVGERRISGLMLLLSHPAGILLLGNFYRLPNMSSVDLSPICWCW